MSAQDSLARPVALLYESIANSPTFQSWTSSADPTAAKQHIFRTALEDLTETLPYAVIEHESLRISLAGRSYERRGAVSFLLYGAVASGATHWDAFSAFGLNAGGVVRDVLDRVGTDSLYALDADVKYVRRPETDERQTAGDYLVVRATVTFVDTVP